MDRKRVFAWEAGLAALYWLAKGYGYVCSCESRVRRGCRNVCSACRKTEVSPAPALGGCAARTWPGWGSARATARADNRLPSVATGDCDLESARHTQR